MAKKITRDDLQKAYEAGYEDGQDDANDGFGYNPDFDGWYEENYGDKE